MAQIFLNAIALDLCPLAKLLKVRQNSAICIAGKLAQSTFSEVRKELLCAVKAERQ